MRFNSLTARVLLFASVWSIIALVAIALVISTLYERNSERGYQALLQAHLNSVINAVSMDAQGQLQGTPQLGSLLFSQPSSGWYFIVDPIAPATGPRIASASIGTDELAVPSTQDYPFDADYIRLYPARDAAGNLIDVFETEINLGAGAARFRVTGNHAILEQDVSAFSSRIYLALALFGLGSLIINALAILYGLKPLDRVRAALERIRGGEESRLTGNFPREISPLAGEVNQLIEMNARVVERARKQVGNLAHSLKTPIAVLLNESRDLDPKHGELVRNQVESMRSQVQTYLDRARIAAQRGSVLARTDAAEAVGRMLRVMGKLNPDIDFRMEVSPPGAILALEQQDFEEALGNLLENAARFARSKVTIRVTAQAEDEASEGRNWMSVHVDDDGPGLTQEQRAEALKRGRRLDESRPGTGLGLSIVAEIASEYGGAFSLGASPSGGLSARIRLPGFARAQ